PQFMALAQRLKAYASTAADFAIAPAEHAAPSDLSRRYDALRVLCGPSTTYMVLVQPTFWLLMALTIIYAPVAGLIALGLWHAETIVALVAIPLRPRDLVPVIFLRAPIEMYLLARTAVGHRSATDLAAARRAAYESDLARGLERFFEPRRDTCPICSSRD